MSASVMHVGQVGPGAALGVPSFFQRAPQPRYEVTATAVALLTLPRSALLQHLTREEFVALAAHCNRASGMSMDLQRAMSWRSGCLPHGPVSPGALHLPITGTHRRERAEVISSVATRQGNHVVRRGHQRHIASPPAIPSPLPVSVRSSVLGSSAQTMLAALRRSSERAHVALLQRAEASKHRASARELSRIVTFGSELHAQPMVAIASSRSRLAAFPVRHVKSSSSTGSAAIDGLPQARARSRNGTKRAVWPPASPTSPALSADRLGLAVIPNGAQAHPVIPFGGARTRQLLTFERAAHWDRVVEGSATLIKDFAPLPIPPPTSSRYGDNKAAECMRRPAQLHLRGHAAAASAPTTTAGMVSPMKLRRLPLPGVVRPSLGRLEPARLRQMATPGARAWTGHPRAHAPPRTSMQTRPVFVIRLRLPRFSEAAHPAPEDAPNLLAYLSSASKHQPGDTYFNVAERIRAAESAAGSMDLPLSRELAAWWRTVSPDDRGKNAP